MIKKEVWKQERKENCLPITKITYEKPPGDRLKSENQRGSKMGNPVGWLLLQPPVNMSLKFLSRSMGGRGSYLSQKGRNEIILVR